ncbi:MAG: arginyltransferase [Planctomycetes bacterium]|nr:arginyltransferase [Planctomycetota bacterium]
MSDGRLRGEVIDAGPCPYLPERRFHVFHAIDRVDGGLYRILLDNRFRRNGAMVYTTMCPGCDACLPLRVPVRDFAPRRDQRRVLRRNADLALSWHARGCDPEREALWRRYQAAVHQDAEDASPERFMAEDGGVPGGELHARDRDGRLLGVAMCDVVGDAWSSVYCYWEPAEEARGLGTYMALAEIAEAARRGLRWWYPGYWVPGCAKMAYKARFRPAQVLRDGVWTAMDSGEAPT